MRKNKKKLNCLICDKEFEVIFSSKRKYCSKLCSGKMNIGKKYSKEHNKNISLSKIGKKLSKEHIEKNRINSILGGQKISKIRKGKTYIELYGKEKANKIKENLSKKHMGQKAFMKGKKWENILGKEKADKFKDKIRRGVLKTTKGVAPKSCFKKGNIPYNKGKKWEEIFDINTIEERKRKWRKIMNEKVIMPLKDTKPEKEMQKILDDLNIEYNKHFCINNIKHFYQCDIFIPREKIIIEVDGKYWHNYPNLRSLDIIRNKELKEAGYKVLRFWEGEFNTNIVNNKLLKLKTPG